MIWGYFIIGVLAACAFVVIAPRVDDGDLFDFLSETPIVLGIALAVIVGIWPIIVVILGGLLVLHGLGTLATWASTFGDRDKTHLP